MGGGLLKFRLIKKGKNLKLIHSSKQADSQYNPTPIARLSLHDFSFCASRQKKFFRLRHALRLAYVDEAVAFLFVPYNAVSGSEGKIHVRE